MGLCIYTRASQPDKILENFVENDNPQPEVPEKWVQSWLASRDDPRIFCTGVLGLHPPGTRRPDLATESEFIVIEPWQWKLLTALAEGETRISIRAGHGVGKSAVLSWIILWLMFTRRDLKIPLAASSAKQLRDVNMPELKKWSRHLPEPLKAEIEVNTERAFIKSDPEMSFCVARTCGPDNVEALQGFHAQHLAYILDEASGIIDPVFEAAIGALSTPGAIQIMVGNPTKRSGKFYRSHTADRDGYWTLRVSSEEVPRARGHIDQVIREYGKESNQYRVRVSGEFPLADDDTLIGLDIIEASIQRPVLPQHVLPIWGVDPARFGSDRSALAKRKGNVLLEPIKYWHQRDTMTLAGIIKQEYDNTDLDDQPHVIVVDSIGIGAGVADRLTELGLPVHACNVGERPSIAGQYSNLRAELWFAGRDWFAERNCSIPKDDDLISELSVVTYKITSTGKLQMESKDDMKKRGLKSPDLADSFIMTFAVPEQRTQAASALDRHRRGAYSARRGSSWSA